MSAYFIVNYTVDDQDAYDAYSAEAAILLGVGAKAVPIVFNSESKAIEGEPGQTTVVLKYESLEEAEAAYNSTEYQKLLPKRLAATSNHFGVLVQGLG